MTAAPPPLPAAAPSDPTRRGPLARILRALLAAYIVLLVASSLWRWLGDGPPRRAIGGPSVELQAVDGTQRLDEPVRVAYREWGDRDDPTIVLLHGSPGSAGNFGRLAPRLAERLHVIAPDLPGFGSSRLDVPDYSIVAHGDYVLQLLDALDLPSAHLLGYSMGGGPAIHAWEQSPERVASLTMLASIGVQELELLGDHDLNHAVHGLQLLGFVGLRALLPHFDRTAFFDEAIAYARNFYDTDQRPLRDLLAGFEPPLLVIHGSEDFLVPPAAAVEHHRIVPHSELWMWEGEDHFVVFRDRPELAERITDFVERVERDEAQRRPDATAGALARAAEPFDPAVRPPATGMWLIVLMFLIALATLVSEDLTCIGAGLMVSQGQIGFIPAVIACFVGIFIGDVGLFLAGRWLGRPAVRRAPLKWVVTEGGIARSSAWFASRGPAVILLSRFLPGARLPTYFTAGVLHTSLLWFCAWFALAGLLWTPALVALSLWTGRSFLEDFTLFQEHALLGLALVASLLLLVVKVGVPLLSHRGRRLLRGAWLRKVRWEFWPPWMFYPPIVLYVLWLALKHRSFAVVTAVNPAIPGGGFIGESKDAILRPLQQTRPDFLPRTQLVPGELPTQDRVDRVLRFVQEHGLEWPVVLKPDAGQRGSGVAFPDGPDAVAAYLERAPVDTLVQEHVGGVEFGVFYYREPDAPRGRLFSITEKILPVVTGDGSRTVEQLVLDDARAPAMASLYLDSLASRLSEVPGPGEEVPLARLGTHCRGAVFLDGARLASDALLDTIEHVSRGIDGFFFGRFDVKVPSAESLQQGRGLTIIELNGLTSEATHIYDPSHSVFHAWRVLAEQWRVAFRIGAANVARGARPYRLRDLVRDGLGFLRTARRRQGV